MSAAIKVCQSASTSACTASGRGASPELRDTGAVDEANRIRLTVAGTAAATDGAPVGRRWPIPGGGAATWRR